jgi:hypothetical protein
MGAVSFSRIAVGYPQAGIWVERLSTSTDSSDTEIMEVAVSDSSTIAYERDDGILGASCLQARRSLFDVVKL